MEVDVKDMVLIANKYTGIKRLKYTCLIQQRQTRRRVTRLYSMADVVQSVREKTVCGSNFRVCHRNKCQRRPPK